MSISIGGECKQMLYANDIAILNSHRDPRVISGRLGQELESCYKWLVENKLSLHLVKTESIRFGSKRTLKKVNGFSITCNGQTMNNQKSVEILGIFPDQKLSGEAIANEFIKKSNARLRLVYLQGGFDIFHAENIMQFPDTVSLWLCTFIVV